MYLLKEVCEIFISILGKIKLNAAIRIVAVFISLFLQVYIVRSAGEVAYGEYSVFVALVSFLVIFGKVGGDVVCTREIATDLKIKNGERFWSIVFSVLTFSFFASAIVSVIYLVLFWRGGGLSGIKVVFGLYVVSSFLIMIAVFRGMFKDVHADLLENVARPVVFASLISVFLVFGFSNQIDVSFLFVLATFLVAVFGWFFIVKERGFFRVGVRLDFSLLKGMSGIVGAGFSSYCLFQLDRLFLAEYVSAAEVGGYNMVCNFVRIVPFFSFLIASKMQPVLAENWGRGDGVLFYADAKKILLSSMFFGFFGVLILVVSGEWILNFTSPMYKKMYLVLIVVAIGHFFNCVAVSINTVLHMARLDSKSAVNQGVSALIGAVLFYFLIPVYGVMGAAISASIAMFFGFLFSLRGFFSIKV